MHGVIVRVGETYGFIRGEDGKDRFFLPSAMQQSSEVIYIDLREGMFAEFVAIHHPKGPRAIEVMVRNPRRQSGDSTT